MHLFPTALSEVKIFEPASYEDERGLFFESYNEDAFKALLGFSPTFMQDNHSHSKYHVLRGLHYQLKHPQGKLVRVVSGEVFDVAVDLRRHSPSYGKWVGKVLSSTNRHQLWIPPGFAHGFLVLSKEADLLYKVTAPYIPEDEQCIIWDDPDLSIEWPIETPPLLSEKDAGGKFLREAEVY